MDKDTKELVCRQIEVYLIKYPTAFPSEIKTFILAGAQGDSELSQVSSILCSSPSYTTRTNAPTLAPVLPVPRGFLVLAATSLFMESSKQT